MEGRHIITIKVMGTCQYGIGTIETLVPSHNGKQHISCIFSLFKKYGTEHFLNNLLLLELLRGY